MENNEIGVFIEHNVIIIIIYIFGEKNFWRKLCQESFFFVGCKPCGTCVLFCSTIFVNQQKKSSLFVVNEIWSTTFLT